MYLTILSKVHNAPLIKEHKNLIELKNFLDNYASLKDIRVFEATELVAKKEISVVKKDDLVNDKSRKYYDNFKC